MAIFNSYVKLPEGKLERMAIEEEKFTWHMGKIILPSTQLAARNTFCHPHIPCMIFICKMYSSHFSLGCCNVYPYGAFRLVMGGTPTVNHSFIDGFSMKVAPSSSDKGVALF